MRELLSSAVYAVLLSTAACATAPVAPAQARLEAPASRPASAQEAASKAVEGPAIPAGWTLVTSAEGGFRAAFPFAPEIESTDLETGNGKARTIIYGGYPEKEGSYLMVAVSKFPPGMDGLAYSDVMMNSARDGSLAKTHTRLVSDKPVRVDGPGSGGTRSFPGLDYEATGGPEGMRISARIIIAEDRLYQLMFAHKDGETETFTRFLSTFALQ
jgi:hypothetical protein